MADLDTGYGNPLNVIRTVEELVSFQEFEQIIEVSKYRQLEQKFLTKKQSEN